MGFVVTIHMSRKEGRGNKMDGLVEVDEVGMWRKEEGRKERSGERS